MSSDQSPLSEPIKKFEIREQDGINKAQSENATAWINLTQLLEKVLAILNNRDLSDIVALSVNAGATKIGEDALKENERWKEIFGYMASNCRVMADLLDQQKHLAEQMIVTLRALNSLPDDERLIKRTSRLTECLNELERHHKSGLLEAIAKL